MAFEEGTQAQWLHDLLEPYAEQVVVCNVRGKRELADKSEKAVMIAEARKQPGWRFLRSVPFLGPVRVSQRGRVP